MKFMITWGLVSLVIWGLIAVSLMKAKQVEEDDAGTDEASEG